MLTWPLPPAITKLIQERLFLSILAGRESQLRPSFYSPLNSMWQSALGSSSSSKPGYSPVTGAGASSSSSVSLPGFYSSPGPGAGPGYPPTPPKAGPIFCHKLGK